MPDLLCYKLNAGADVGQPENCPRAPTACLQAVRWLWGGGLFGGLGCFYCVWMFQGSLKRVNGFQAAFGLAGLG